MSDDSRTTLEHKTPESNKSVSQYHSKTVLWNIHRCAGLTLPVFVMCDRPLSTAVLSL